jgi:hypothetical protein
MSETPSVSELSATVIQFASLAQETSAARDAVRQSAIDAGSDKPREIGQRIAANWLRVRGESWSSTSTAIEAFKQSTIDEAHSGSAAYVLGVIGNAYTAYLQEHFGRFPSPSTAAMAGPEWEALKQSAFRAATPERFRFGDPSFGDAWKAFRKLHPVYQFGLGSLWLTESSAVTYFWSSPKWSIVDWLILPLTGGLFASG